MGVAGRESLGIYEVEIEVGRKTREGGRRQEVTSNHNRKTRRPSETVESRGGPEPRNRRRGNTTVGGVRAFILIFLVLFSRIYCVPLTAVLFFLFIGHVHKSRK